MRANLYGHVAAEAFADCELEASEPPASAPATTTAAAAPSTAVNRDPFTCVLLLFALEPRTSCRLPPATVSGYRKRSQWPSQRGSDAAGRRSTTSPSGPACRRRACREC